MSMEQRISIVTLGVRDVERARAFYEALGWKAGMVVPDDVSFFQAGGMIFGLWQREKLAADAGLSADGSGFSGVSLAYNARSEAEVDAVIAEAEAAGATILKRPQRAFYGGWYAYFADPEGHVWEVAHNPQFPIDADGRIALPA
jgi:uncharacterized protein